MSRSIQVGDFVYVSLGEYSQYFQIIDISDKIYISNVADPKEISAIEYETDVPKIYGTDLNFQITFLSSVEYQNMANLGNLPPDIIIEIGLKLDTESLSKLCRANKMLNSILCDNENYWKLRYEQDFGELSIRITDWKEEYKIMSSDQVFTFGYSGLEGPELRNVGTRMFPTLVSEIRAKMISTGRNHMIVIDLDDNIYTFGDNRYGQLGLGDTSLRMVPTQILGIKAKTVSAGEFHTVIIDFDGNVFTFGNNRYGQLGLEDTNNRMVPTQIPGIRAKTGSAGRFHTMIIGKRPL